MSLYHPLEDAWETIEYECLMCAHQWLDGRPVGSYRKSLCPKCGCTSTQEVP